MKSFRKPRKFNANVVIIGGGSAGLVAAIIASGAKAGTILIEKHKMGGDCLNTGCVPSKTLLRSGRIMSYLRRAREYGINGAAGSVDFAAVMDRVQSVIKIIEPHDSVERFSDLGVDCISGDARVSSPWTVEVNGRSISTRAIILASGGRPLVPQIPGLEQVDYLTSDTLWSLRELPKRMLVVGGGPIGCEMAQAFSHLGSKVAQVDLASRIMPREDSEVSETVTAKFREQGIKVLTGYRPMRFFKDDSGYMMEAEGFDAKVCLGFDKVLLAIGRKANVEGLGLEALDMPLTSQGTVQVNHAMQTAYPSIYACGDVAGPYQFTHMASYQAFFASINSLMGSWWRLKANYRAVPWATFTDPEVARVGLSETEAREQGVVFEVTRFDMNHLDRALAEGEAHGFIKVLTVPGRDRILGVTIVGHHASELIGEFVLAMTHGLGLKKIAAVTHIYPTLSEANKFAANAWRNARLPEKYFPLMERFFRWQRGQ